MHNCNILLPTLGKFAGDGLNPSENLSLFQHLDLAAALAIKNLSDQPFIDQIIQLVAQADA